MVKKSEKTYIILLIFYVLIQPVLDVMWLNDGTVPEIAGFSLPTIIRMVFIACLGLLSFMVIKFNRKHLFILGYCCLIAVYFVVHHFVCTDFYSLVPGNFNYSVVGELFYVVRMCIPLAMIYFTYNSDITRELFERVLLILSLIMSVSCIITNIFKVAYGSYTSEFIAGNIFDWFIHYNEYTSNQIASKGIFYSSITSTVMVLIYPLLLYLFLEKWKIRYFISAVLQAVALLMVGTKATGFSVLIVSVIMSLVYFFVVLIKRDFKLNRVACCGIVAILAINFVLFNFSPAVAKMDFDRGYSREIDEKEEEDKEHSAGELSEDEKEELIAFFDDNYHYLSINESFLLEAYPYKYDPVFWYDFYSNYVPSQRMQNRLVQEEMLKRVKEINDNDLADWFGIGYTRTSNIFNLERDFIYQYYSLGAVGAVLFLGPYVAVLLLVMIKMLYRFKARVTLFNCSLVLGIGLSLFLAYYSGNVMENLGITIVLGFVLGYLYKDINNGQERNNEELRN